MSRLFLVLDLLIRANDDVFCTQTPSNSTYNADFAAFGWRLRCSLNFGQPFLVVRRFFVCFGLANGQNARRLRHINRIKGVIRSLKVLRRRKNQIQCASRARRVIIVARVLRRRYFLDFNLLRGRSRHVWRRSFAQTTFCGRRFRYRNNGIATRLVECIARIVVHHFGTAGGTRARRRHRLASRKLANFVLFNDEFNGNLVILVKVLVQFETAKTTSD